jgi:hypothetical protein
MGMMRWIIGGLIGGLIGTIAWVLIGYFLHAEIGWIAWGIGLLVGIGVRYGAYQSGHDESFAQGIVAGALAIGVIVCSKYLLYTLLVGSVASSELEKLKAEVVNDESMVASIASEISEERENKGIAVKWPAGLSAEDAVNKADYPADIWTEAEGQWKALSPAEQQQRKDHQSAALAAFLEAATPPFSEMFSPWDLLWFGLATFTAFRVGIGAVGND